MNEGDFRKKRKRGKNGESQFYNFYLKKKRKWKKKNRKKNKNPQKTNHSAPNYRERDKEKDPPVGPVF